MKINRLKAVIFAVILSVSLCGCGNEITEGVVYEKEFVPAHTETTLMPIVITTGKTITTTFIPQTHDIPDKWYICIRSKEADEEGNYQKSKYSVSEEIFNQYEVGDFYSHEK